MKSTLQTRVPENFRYCRWGAERRVPRARTRERGPPSALAEIIGPSGAVQTVSDSRRPLFLVINLVVDLDLVLGTVAQNP